MDDKTSFLIKFSALTVADLKSLVKEFDLKNQICMNSNFTEDYTVKLATTDSFDKFTPITMVHVDKYEVTFVADFNTKHTGKTISEIYETLSVTSDELEIERDVDDGYRFEAYEQVLITDNYLIFF